ncbi:hypothetical protein CPAR01_07794 [Colletotrichum paranaense]|uniref:Uncharacterized protein n=1 Tax=Colletotrichum paranaense TaxID=1914294 RepID=A0ABQ9SIG0_9PEZI|nr:uncharacterized protein CPAR01_07794 [Colletotrichum paranaense]KAK1537681.1 hypothetical protein CPAR01_07794 [Colletotrichum paranaense]
MLLPTRFLFGRDQSKAEGVSEAASVVPAPALLLKGLLASLDTIYLTFDSFLSSRTISAPCVPTHFVAMLSNHGSREESKESLERETGGPRGGAEAWAGLLPSTFSERLGPTWIT